MHALILSNQLNTEHPSLTALKFNLQDAVTHIHQLKANKTLEAMEGDVHKQEVDTDGPNRASVMPKNWKTVSNFNFMFMQLVHHFMTSICRPMQYPSSHLAAYSTGSPLDSLCQVTKLWLLKIFRYCIRNSLGSIDLVRMQFFGLFLLPPVQ